MATLMRAVRGVMATAIVVAIVVQLFASADRPTFDAVDFFSYFTVLSNIAAVAVLGAAAVRPGLLDDDRFQAVRGAATLYMTVTGLVYAVLLAPQVSDLGLTELWVNTVLHQVGPAVVVLDWLVAPPPRRPSLRTAAAWLLFPVVWLAYTFVRAAAVDWYPYPFLDPDEDGVGAVVVSCIAITVLFVLLAAALRWWAGRADTAGRAVRAGASAPGAGPPP
jgi:hypothetical protein